MPQTKLEARKYGDHVEVRHYIDKPITYGYKSTRRGRPRVRILRDGNTQNEKRLERSQKKSLRRARNAIREIVMANSGQWERCDGEAHNALFLTLTFADANISETKAKSEFMKFIQRWIYQRKKAYGLFEKVKYIAVTERQAERRNAPHLHVLLLNVGFVQIDELQELWGLGQVHIQRAGSTYESSARLANYITKEFGGVEVNKKRYFCSRGIKRAVRERDEGTVRAIVQGMHTAPIETEEYTSRFLGRVVKKVYKQPESNSDVGSVID